MGDAFLPPVGIKTRQSLPTQQLTSQLTRAESSHSSSEDMSCLLHAHGSKRNMTCESGRDSRLLITTEALIACMNVTVASVPVKIRKLFVAQASIKRLI